MDFKNWHHLQEAFSILRGLDAIVTPLKKLFNFNKPTGITVAKLKPSRANYAFRTDEFEPKLFGQGCNSFCQFVKKYVPEYEGSLPKKQCGSEGCAYFIGNYVFKATFGADEFQTAQKLKASTFVPVIDAYQDQDTGVYFIAMDRMEQPPEQVAKDIDCAANLVKQYVNNLIITGVPEQNLIAQLNINNLTKWARRNMPQYNCPEITSYLLNFVAHAYKSTGLMVHRDLTTQGNVMYGSGKPKVIDMGYGAPYNQLAVR